MERACGRHTSHFLQEPAWTAGQRRTWELAALSWQETIPANVFCPAESWQKNLPSQMPSSYLVFCVLGWLCADSPCYLGALTLPQLSRGCSQVPKRLCGSSLPLSSSFSPLWAHSHEAGEVAAAKTQGLCNLKANYSELQRQTACSIPAEERTDTYQGVHYVSHTVTRFSPFLNPQSNTRVGTVKAIL